MDIESRELQMTISALPAPFKYTSTGSKVDWANYDQEVRSKNEKQKLSCFGGDIPIVRTKL